jgi:hypothetical protein
VAAALLAACGGGGSAPCTKDDQCASHFCRADGTCAPATPDGAPIDTGTTIDASIDGASSLCTPNHDGMITQAELPLIAGRSAKFRVATSAAINTAGVVTTPGMRAWDYSGALSGDNDTTISLLSPTGTWWASEYPTATYAAPLSATADTLGIFEVTPTAVNLLAAVSPTNPAFQTTDLKYSPPAQILKLPLTASATWTSTSAISGTYQGVTSAYNETYASTADQIGTVTTPYGAFPTIRVATSLTRSILGTTTLTKKTFAFEVECFGTVATLVSKDNETAAEFTTAAEVRRLAP